MGRTIDLDKQFEGAPTNLQDLLEAQAVPIKELGARASVHATWDFNEAAKRDAVFKLVVDIDGHRHELYFFKSHFTSFLRAV